MPASTASTAAMVVLADTPKSDTAAMSESSDAMRPPLKPKRLRITPVSKAWFACAGISLMELWLAIIARPPAAAKSRHGRMYTSIRYRSPSCAGAPSSPPNA